MSSVLFLTRTWHGYGGMQRYSKDLCAQLGETYGMRFHCEHPARGGWTGWFGFVFRALRTGWNDGRAGWRIHLGDASLLPLGIVLSMLTRAPLSVTVCGLDIVYPKRWYQRVLRMGLRRCYRVVCLSNAAAREIQQRGVPDERIVIIPPGLSPARSAPLPSQTAPRAPALVSVGRLIPRKGIAWFVERVFPILAEEMPDLTYAIVGEGPEEHRIASIIHREGFSRRVRLCRSLSDDERDALMDRSSLFLMPNVPIAGDMEGFGIVCIEAASRGLPVVASRMEGIPDAVLDGETGGLFAPGDVHDCLRVVRDLLRSPLDRTAVAECVWARFDWKALMHRYQALVFDAVL